MEKLETYEEEYLKTERDDTAEDIPCDIIVKEEPIDELDDNFYEPLVKLEIYEGEYLKIEDTSDGNNEKEYSSSRESTGVEDNDSQMKGETLNECNRNRHTCEQCFKSYSTERKLKRHQLAHEVHCFPCNKCSKSFVCKDSLTAHQLAMHEDPEKFKCNLCIKSYSSKKNLKRHLLTHESNRLACDKCSASFSEKWNLKAHQRVVHEGIKHTCNQCSKTYSRTNDLKKHMLTHEGLITTRFPCNKCSKSFTQKKNLNRHQRVHEGITFPSNKKCSASFSQKSTLKTHQLGVHEGIKEFTCDLCLKTFSLKIHLKKHILLTHGGTKFPCDKYLKTGRDDTAEDIPCDIIVKEDALTLDYGHTEASQ
uniref:Zinc finger protein 271 n=2 Tax=Cacopsylla melanoneura TaxID=428564 RepID=A0A8D8UKY4_9HEMI